MSSTFTEMREHSKIVAELTTDLMLMPRGDRIPHFIEWWEAQIDEHAADDVARRLFPEVWQDAEFPENHADEVRNMLRWLTGIYRNAHTGPITDTEEELTGMLTVYRGVSGDAIRDGISWTLDLEVAQWFARRFAILYGAPRVYEAQIDASKVLAYITSRGESEVLVDSSDLTNIRELEGATE